MSKSRVVFAGLVVSLLSGPAFASQAASANGGGSQAATDPYETKLVCRSEQKTGTRFTTRICHTNKEWDQIREQARRDAREMIDKAIVETRGD